ncbi:tRNA pseudouridine(38-40) synthase TruA [Gleimia sp. 6138-11-ORH1]|uniref:tRNA pseudouridine(38-40) synthase TruA n=1 Tax=Gleimia sp. 6138-11-ORH1 TaxID=2973937 RepID=UPI002167DF26|nr:tRNA pseudouridine(38-40) synthase TruA [Gleimia sp. 6138-11-ORH1]MCS4484585.1 tRNA pseudouridine(38-40) synthase TruA [Gleimia sp. 6138-11-ORH1]
MTATTELPNITRIRLDCAYKGTAFHGWAKQPGQRTVQGTLENALELVFRRPIELTVAGRTDAGVHAQAQVAHFEVNATELSAVTKTDTVAEGLKALLRRLNRLIDRPREKRGGQADLVVHQLSEVPTSFDARFAAKRRHYIYRLATSGKHDPLRGDFTWWVAETLDLTKMREGAQLMLGEHDFLSFCKPREGASTVRTLEKLELRATEAEIEVHLTADAFCHSMVRSIVGALVEIGKGKRELTWLQSLIEHPSRQAAAPLAPPHGLTLAKVDYPPAEEWESQQRLTRRFRSLCEAEEISEK